MCCVTAPIFGTAPIIVAFDEGIVDRMADGSDAGAGWELAGLVIKTQNRASAKLVTTGFVVFIFMF
jgi:hypothetical protein